MTRPSADQSPKARARTVKSMAPQRTGPGATVSPAAVPAALPWLATVSATAIGKPRAWLKTMR